MRRPKSVFLFLLGLVAIPTLRGQSSLSLSPVQLEFALAAGKSEEGALTIGNDAAEAIRVRAEVVAWTTGIPGVDIFPAEGAPALSSQDWFSVVGGEFTIPAGEFRDMPFIVAVPEDAVPGQYPAVISIQAVSYESGDGLFLQGKLTALAVVTIGKHEDAGTIEDLAVERRDGRSILVLRRKNGGRFFSPTEGELILRNEKGQKVLAAEFSADPVPPLSERIFRIPVEGEIAAGRYEAECILRPLTGKKISLTRPIIVE
ncbi:MAG: hypothetical protein NTW38_04305 [Candidatus Aminicenantes bacterium]|nr:hypothetical protein [Candidatus Aminicenantes bacterium]